MRSTGEFTVGDRPRVLLVDDEPDVLMLLQAVLSADYELQTASDGAQAWSALLEGDVVDLVICDLGMPNMTGDELVAAMHADENLTAIPVLLLTGDSSDTRRLGMIEAGVSDYVLKPFSPEELRARVRNILRDGALLREVRAARKATEAANRELREVNGELDRFASAAAHDLQAPLANIAGYAQLISEGRVTDDEKRAQLLEAISDNANRAILLVRGLLDHARTFASLDDVEAIDLVWVLGEVALHLDTAISDAGVHLVIDGDLDKVMGRPIAVESVLLNLLSNAIKYRDPNRPLVVEIATTATRSGLVEIMVRDNGLGIPEADRERVFALGERGYDLAEDLDGTGIGLATVRAVVSRHGGMINLEDSPAPGGLTVRFTMPAG